MSPQNSEEECLNFVRLICKATDTLLDAVVVMRNALAESLKSGREADSVMVNALPGVMAEVMARTICKIDNREEGEVPELHLKLRTEIIKFVHDLMRKNVKADALFVLKMPDET